MFTTPGPLELAVILIIALIVLGPKRLPEAARSVGRGVRELREAMAAPDFSYDKDEDAKDDEDDEDDEDEDDAHLDDPERFEAHDEDDEPAPEASKPEPEASKPQPAEAEAEPKRPSTADHS